VKLTADEKRAHVEAFLDSNLSAVQYARENGLCRESLRRWVRGDGFDGRPPHPKREEAERLMAEGLSPWKCALMLGLGFSTVQYWARQK
jgi:transposase-like protein